MKFFHNTSVGQLMSLMLGLFLFVAVIGCAGKPAVKQEIRYIPRVTLAPGDVIDVKFFYTPELNETQTVRPDGMITLQLVGDINVQEKTIAGLEEHLIELYRVHLKNPEISVIPRSLYSNRVFVDGEVNTPGYIDMPGRLTAVEAVIRAGGFDLRTAKLKNVVVIRHKNGIRSVYKLNLKNALNGKEIQPFYLEQFDIIYVPRTRIANVNQWVDQHISGMIPRIGLITIPLR